MFTQEDGNLFADPREARVEHDLRCCADHNPIAIPDGQTEQGVANGASYEIGIHRSDAHRQTERPGPTRGARLPAAWPSVPAPDASGVERVAVARIAHAFESRPVAEQDADPVMERSWMAEPRA